MNRWLGGLPFKAVLSLLVVLPLLAVLILGFVMLWSQYTGFRSLGHAMKLELLARKAGAMATALPRESAAPAEKRAEARRDVDDAQAELVSAYDSVVEARLVDGKFADKKRILDGAFAKIPEFRAQVDADSKDQLLALKYIQPAAAAAIDLTAHIVGLIDDPEIARAVLGYNSFMQVNDGSLILMRVGRQYMTVGSLKASEYIFYSKGATTVANFTAPFVQFVPEYIRAKYEDFWRTPDGTLIQKVLTDMGKQVSFTPQPSDLDAWTKAMVKRRDLVASLLNETVANISRVAQDKYQAAQTQLVVLVLSFGSFVAAVILTSVVMAMTLSGSIRRIASRMRELSKGSKQDPIPYVSRRDEIGEMARAVEIFRQAAIQNEELVRKAEDSRRAVEEQRIEMQRQAEADTEAQLQNASDIFASSLRRLAAGDMQCEIDVAMTRPFDALQNDFNGSVRVLRETLIGVDRLVTSVKANAFEVSSGADDLARRTESQAAALEETAAALGELTTNVQSTSAQASEARRTVREARSQADQSGTVARDAVSAMNRIEASSKEIDQIIGVIDEIAFQTNLLALNAGVEAARAGEAGRGFAVVAQEVRGLAQRSAEAAKQIKALIHTSATAVRQGVDLVKLTGEGLDSIGQMVRSVQDKIETIAGAAEEQARGLLEVNEAVNDMDQTTQKNAAKVQDLNGSGSALASESESLAGLLSGFEFAGHGRQLSTVAARMRSAAGSPTAATKRQAR